MSDRIVSADEARERLADLEGVDPKWHGTGDSFLAAAMRTIIAQAEQIKRLRAAVVDAADALDDHFFGSTIASLTRREIITAADMEEQ